MLYHISYIYIYNHYIDLISYICQKLDLMLDHSPFEDMMLTAAAEEFDNLDADEAKPRWVSP